MIWARQHRNPLATVQATAEHTPAGRAVISTLIVIIVTTGVLWSVPDSAISRQAQPVLEPFGRAAGLDQHWGVFAPNPPSRVQHISVVVTQADGRDVVWNTPRWDPVVEQYWLSRWGKLQENVIRDPSLRPGFAHWAVSEVAGPAGGATRVRIELRTVPLSPPGGTVTPAASTEILYNEDLARHP